MTNLSGAIEAMAGGDKLGLTVEDGDTYVVTYHESPAYGDNGRPVPGDTTGDFTLYAGDLDDPAGWKFVTEARVGPHGTSGYGNNAAKGRAAERIAESATRRARDRYMAGVTGR